MDTGTVGFGPCIQLLALELLALDQWDTYIGSARLQAGQQHSSPDMNWGSNHGGNDREGQCSCVRGASHRGAGLARRSASPEKFQGGIQGASQLGFGSFAGKRVYDVNVYVCVCVCDVYVYECVYVMCMYMYIYTKVNTSPRRRRRAVPRPPRRSLRSCRPPSRPHSCAAHVCF